MTRLMLGVENVAYSDPDVKGATTTGEVATILEDKYHVMRVFVELHGQTIADVIARNIANDLDALLHGERISKLPLQGAMGNIESGFRDYLSADEWQKTSGQAIAAAQNGVSHRFKNAQNKTVSAKGVVKAGGGMGMTAVAKKSRGPRPAFIDTGLYSASFRAEIK
ncbi:hypothetical protein [Acidithiobacillus sp.]|uniref:hypothetical protein n=1 Tax=Acidithiobacillus sp. TaxID=1872118 RepID=UPI003D06F3D4